jgi:hypothetical protein
VILKKERTGTFGTQPCLVSRNFKAFSAVKPGIDGPDSESNHGYGSAKYRHHDCRTPQACNEAGITVQTFYRWRKEYVGLKLEQAKRMKDLEKENTRLKRLVAELSLEKQVLKDVASGNF